MITSSGIPRILGKQVDAFFVTLYHTMIRKGLRGGGWGQHDIYVHSPRCKLMLPLAKLWTDYILRNSTQEVPLLGG